MSSKFKGIVFFIVMSVLWSVVFVTAMHTWAGVGIGICFGIIFAGIGGGGSKEEKNGAVSEEKQDDEGDASTGKIESGAMSGVSTSTGENEGGAAPGEDTGENEGGAAPGEDTDENESGAMPGTDENED